ncbi:hypothetical protein K5D32_02745 [Pseudomonas cichorii]|uniref:hypothetical protein n=1 Tax=Pseudomonas cichorii TaxID=36746 RepID=UPI001C8ACEC3|nr:hypothetical protein [Pseudomonas cichorii]MBX8528562.1 hypothetical protein [Pseudomonas cichorii]
MQQRYMLTIWDLFTMNGSDVCGGEAVIAIINSGQEVDRIIVSGKCQGTSGYRRSYTGMPGLTARLVSGAGSISFESHNLDRELAAVGLGLSEGWGSGKPA